MSFLAQAWPFGPARQSGSADSVLIGIVYLLALFAALLLIAAVVSFMRDLRSQGRKPRREFKHPTLKPLTK